MPRRSPALLFAALAFACSSNGGGGGGGGGAAGAPVVETCDPAAPAATVEWDRAAAETLLPFPSDFFTAPDPAAPTGLRPRIVPGENLSKDDVLARSVGFALENLSDLDGWGTTANLMVKLSGRLDLLASGAPEATTFDRVRPRRHLRPEDAAIFILNIDRDSPRYGERRGVLVDQFEDGALALEPAPPLESATRYALVMTRALVAEGGGCVRRSDAYAAAFSGAPETTPAQIGAGSFARTSAEAALAADPWLTEDNVVLAEAFTTQTTSDELIEVLDAVDATPLPEVVPGSLTVEKVADGPIGTKIRGKFLSPDYRGGGRRWERAADGKYRRKGDASVDFLLQIPREGTGGRSQPFPVAIFFHGLGGDLETADSAASGVYEQGVATISITAIGHRESDDPTLRQYLLFNLFGVALKQPFALSVTRDNLRQSTVDQRQALRLARRLMEEGFDEAEPKGTPDLDPDAPIGAVGVSMGGIMGTTLASVAPEVRYALLYVGGGAVSRIILESAGFADLQGLIKTILFGTSEVPDSLFYTIFSVVQTMIDPGDPANFARFLFAEPRPGTDPKSVLFVEAVDDEVVPNGSTELLMRVMGAPSLSTGYGPVTGVGEAAVPLRDNIAPGVTAGFYRFLEYRRAPDGPLVPATHGPTITAVEAKAQAARFVETFLDSGSAEIVDPFE